MNIETFEFLIPPVQTGSYEDENEYLDLDNVLIREGAKSLGNFQVAAGLTTHSPSGFKTFFDTYTLTEEIEVHHITIPDSPSDDYLTKNFPKYTFKTRVVILAFWTLMIDQFGNIDIEGLSKFCDYHYDQQFIVFNMQINFKGITRKNPIGKTNLYVDTLNTAYGYSCPLTEKSFHLNRGIQKKNISNKWAFLNTTPKLHKDLALSYLLSKDYYKNGLISMSSKTDQKYRHNISKISPELKGELKKGYEKFISKDFNKLEVDTVYDSDIWSTNNPLATQKKFGSVFPNFTSVTENLPNSRILKDKYYNDYLKPTYETTGVEIISGVTFFEQFPTISDKVFRSVYAKQFSIHINGVGMVKWMEDMYGLDMFRDIIDHSYDEITDHFERLTAAIDRNAHLLDGSTDIHKLWHDNQKRFEDNCEQLDKFFQNDEYRTNFNYEKIKKALLLFGIDSVKN